MNRLKALTSMILLVILLAGCTSKNNDPTPKATSTVLGNWTGTNQHYIYNTLEGSYNVTVTITKTTFTIAYTGSKPVDRDNPNVWTCDITQSITNPTQFTIQVSSTYAIAVVMKDANNATMTSNNKDEIFTLKKE
jgi:hypothetical protein